MWQFRGHFKGRQHYTWMELGETGRWPAEEALTSEASVGPQPTAAASFTPDVLHAVHPVGGGIAGPACGASGGREFWRCRGRYRVQPRFPCRAGARRGHGTTHTRPSETVPLRGARGLPRFSRLCWRYDPTGEAQAGALSPRTRTRAE
jgi:hypothetical protein